jgi:ribosomal protein L28
MSVCVSAYVCVILCICLYTHTLRIFMMGTRRSGKSSIQKVVFHKMSPHETLFIESTNQVVRMHVCMHVCVHVCMHETLCIESTNQVVRMHVCMHVCVHVCMHETLFIESTNQVVRMHVCMHVCMYELY